MNVYPYDCYRRLFTAVARKRWLRDQAFDALDDLKTGTDWQGVAQLARQQNTIAMLWRALGEYQKHCGKAPRKVVDAMEQDCRRAVVMSDRLLESACRISESLASRGIRHAVLKGPWTRQVLYEGEPVRLYSDIDILVDRDHLAALGRALEEEEYVCGECDPVSGRVKIRNVYERRRYMLLFSHPCGWTKVIGAPEDRENRLTVEPHFDVSWPGRGGRRVPPLPAEWLLADGDSIRCAQGEMKGLAPVQALMVACLSIFKDARSLLNIRDATDARLAKLADAFEWVQSFQAAGLAQVWHAAIRYGAVDAVLLCGHYLARIYGLDRLLGERPRAVDSACDLDGYGHGEGFEDPDGGRWQAPLETRYFDPQRRFRLRGAAVHSAEA